MEYEETINLMTQKQLAEKYHVDGTTISTALAMADVPPATTTKALAKKPCKLYDERLAVKALLDLFKRRMDSSVQMAEKWRARIDKIAYIYEYGEE